MKKKIFKRKMGKIFKKWQIPKKMKKFRQMPNFPKRQFVKINTK